ncbi:MULTISPECIES: hypothetical protein [Legionella]|uniref:hypothetical protein n=1 Tax=Legionella TaxID=445 RepID=UPI001AC93320|nr:MULTISPECIES: hypothetical protein [Legionella]MBN9229119.1 hypothetical protein [Legionella steelei]
MITSQLLRTIVAIFYLSGALLFLSSCTGNKNTASQNAGSEEYGTNEYGGWR